MNHWEKLSKKYPAIEKDVAGSLGDAHSAPTPLSDMVNNPAHYQGAIECIDAIEASMTKEAFAGHCKACVIKYVWRYQQKGGVESLEKAEWYLSRLITTEKSRL